MSFLGQTKMTLVERLRHHAGFSVSAEGPDYTLEGGLLENVGRQFMKVNGHYWVPSSLYRIKLHGFTPQVEASTVTIRSISGEAFDAGLVRTGTDFVELLQGDMLILMPLTQIVSIESA